MNSPWVTAGLTSSWWTWPISGFPSWTSRPTPASRSTSTQHTKDWSAKVEAADAFVFVTPEYNYSSPPALINALDYLYKEWNYKPAGFVSYGGISGGIRSVQMTKQMITTLKMVPLVEAVPIPFFSQHIDDTGLFVPNELHQKSATDMLDELLKWAEALKPMRG